MTILDNQEVKEIVVLSIYTVLILGIASLMFGFGLGGFERSDVLEKNNFYIPYGLAFLIGIIVLKFAGKGLFRTKKEEGQLIHDPEQSPLGGFKIVKNPWLLAFFSIIAFSLLGWFFTNQQTFFNETPVYEHQFTTGADLFFSIYPASTAETLGALFMISLFGFILAVFVKRGKLGHGTFMVLFILGTTIVSATYGIINHLARYGFSEIALRNVAIFWAFGGFITSITGSVIPFLFMHDINNFFFRLSKLFSSDVVTFITFTIITILSVFFFILLFRSRGKQTP